MIESVFMNVYLGIGEIFVILCVFWFVLSLIVILVLGIVWNVYLVYGELFVIRCVLFCVMEEIVIKKIIFVYMDVWLESLVIYVNIIVVFGVYSIVEIVLVDVCRVGLGNNVIVSFYNVLFIWYIKGL